MHWHDAEIVSALIVKLGVCLDDKIVMEDVCVGEGTMPID